MCYLLIRLVNGNGRCSGRVEIYYSGQWGTVCDDSWDIKDAEVVCRQLGCESANQVLSKAHYGPGSGTIWLDDVACTGSEGYLTECLHRGFGIHDCSHAEDAGVVCSVKATSQSAHTEDLELKTVIMVKMLVFSASQRIAITANFDLYRGGSPILTQAVESTQTSETFTLSSLQSSHQGRYSCLQQITKNGQKMISSSSSNSMDITIASIVPIIASGAIGGLLLLLLLLIPCLVWRKRNSREQSIMRNPRETAIHMNTYGNTVGEASEEDYEEDYINAETFVNKSKDEDLKKGCHAGMNAPGSMNKCGNNQGKGPEAGEEDEEVYENPDTFTETDLAEDIINKYGNTVGAASEEDDEEEYVNAEIFVNKSKDEDMKKGCHASMNAPGAMNKCGNNQGEGPEAGEEDEEVYENPDTFTETDLAEDMYDEDN
ncbi:unnamed protein product [Coregonus sp. 'balchen']|nr:unnamed protein product [Coregonus sp. 'balchen']